MNEEEDRRRLKEKLKEALESSRRNHEMVEESEGEVYILEWFCTASDCRAM